MRAPARLPVIFVTSAALFAVGCSGAVATTSDASSTSTQALFTVEWSAPAAGSAMGPKAHASAYFLRLQAGADESAAARLVGASLSLPPAGQCAHVGSTADPGFPLATLGPIDLVDVGAVTIDAEHARAVLAERAFPDVVDLVSGVLYTSRDWSADSLPSSGHYWLQASGSPALPALSAEADAPGAPASLQVGGVAVTDQELSVPRDNLAIGWQVTADSNTSSNVVYVDLSSEGTAGTDRVRCTFGDTGSAQIDASALPAGERQSIAVHRVHQESFVTPSGVVGRVRFDLATTGTLRFSPKL